MEAGPVDQPVPAEDRADEDRPLGDGRVPRDMAFCEASASRTSSSRSAMPSAPVSTHDEAEDQEQEPVDEVPRITSSAGFIVMEEVSKSIADPSGGRGWRPVLSS